MADKVDAFVIVGDRKSANTIRLLEIARTIKPTFFVENKHLINPADFQAFRTVGLSSGASTPPFLLDAVKEELEKIPESH